MLKRWFCAILVVALLASLMFVSYRNDDPMYGAAQEEEIPNDGDTVASEEDTITIWYADDALTDYLTGVALSFRQDKGIKVNMVLKDGVEFIEEINAVSVAEDSERSEAMPDMYITSHDNLLRAYLSGIASTISDPAGIVAPEFFSDTALNAVTCYDNYVAYPLYYETNFLLYNKTYMASIAQSRIEAESDLADGQAAQEELDKEGAPTEVAKEISLEEPEDEAGEKSEDESEEESEDESKDESEGNEEGDTDYSDEESAEDSQEEQSGDPAEEDPMGNEDAVADEEVLNRLATMIPATLDDIKTFANNYDAPEIVESVFKWDVTDIFYNYFFVGNYMDVGGKSGDNAAIFNIYNSQAVECLKKYQEMNQFFSIDASVDNYDKILDDFIAGKMVFTVATTDAIDRIHRAQADGQFEFEYGVTTLPDVSSLLKARGLSVTNAVAVNGYSHKQNQANDFATYLVNYKASDLYRKSGKVSCSKNVEYEDGQIMNIMAEYEKSMPLPKMVEASNYWVQLEIALTKIWKGADPDETLKELSDIMGAQIDEIRANLPVQESFSAGAGKFVQ